MLCITSSRTCSKLELTLQSVDASGERLQGLLEVTVKTTEHGCQATMRGCRGLLDVTVNTAERGCQATMRGCRACSKLQLTLQSVDARLP